MFDGWDNFFVMTGTAASGLIGLLFVVVTLTSGTDQARAARGQKLYMTPTALAFATVLVVSAVALAPRLSHGVTAAIVILIAANGGYLGVRATLGILEPQTSGEPAHWSDVWMYGVTPAALYGALGVAALCVAAELSFSAAGIALVCIAMLLVAIRNAWDLLTWIAPRRPAPPPA